MGCQGSLKIIQNWVWKVFNNHQKSNLGAFRAAFGATSVTSRPQGERWTLNLWFVAATWSISDAILEATGFYGVPQPIIFEQNQQTIIKKWRPGTVPEKT